MAALTTDQARELLGAPARLDGHDVLAGRADRRGTVLVTQPRHFWPRLFGARREREARQARPGSRLIGSGAFLLFLLGTGLLAVSFATQYQYVLHERHQHIASLIEAGALDVGLIIFSLLAIGLARAGLSAKAERAAVMGCAVGSAVMNYAAADVTSPRSVLAYCMPPVFLAFVVDRVVRTIQRHVLGMSEGRSPWAVAGTAMARVARFAGLSALYVLRFLVDRKGTRAGIRAAILNATPLPELVAGEDSGDRGTESRSRRRERRQGRQGGTKTERFLALVRQRHGELAAIPLEQVSRIATSLAPDVGLHPASARTALLSAVRAALPSGGSGAR
jgi:hypothetical protein